MYSCYIGVYIKVHSFLSALLTAPSAHYHPSLSISVPTLILLFDFWLYFLFLHYLQLLYISAIIIIRVIVFSTHTHTTFQYQLILPFSTLHLLLIILLLFVFTPIMASFLSTSSLLLLLLPTSLGRCSSSVARWSSHVGEVRGRESGGVGLIEVVLCKQILHWVSTQKKSWLLHSIFILIFPLTVWVITVKVIFTL